MLIWVHLLQYEVELSIYKTSVDVSVKRYCIPLQSHNMPYSIASSNIPFTFSNSLPRLYSCSIPGDFV